jgi:hypothetical protein
MDAGASRLDTKKHMAVPWRNRRVGITTPLSPFRRGGKPVYENYHKTTDSS